MLSLQLGVTLNLSTQSTPGYLLLSPCGGGDVYLVDSCGSTINHWQGSAGLTHWAYLLPNGNLLANECCEEPKGVVLTTSGWMREYDWDGNLVHELLDPWQHHDVRRLDKGNTVYLANTRLDAEQQKKNHRRHSRFRKRTRCIWRMYPGSR